MEDKDKLKQAITNALNSQDAFEKCDDIKPKELYVILVNGKRVKMRSGKMVWNSKGPAKSALRNHMYGLMWKKKINYNDFAIYNKDGTKDYTLINNTIREAEDEWIDKHVVFMPFSEYMSVQRKRGI